MYSKVLHTVQYNTVHSKEATTLQCAALFCMLMYSGAYKVHVLHVNAIEQNAQGRTVQRKELDSTNWCMYQSYKLVYVPIVQIGVCANYANWGMYQLVYVPISVCANWCILYQWYTI